MLDSLFSLEGLVTFSIVFTVSIRALFISFNHVDNSVVVSGDNNIVFYNYSMQTVQDQYNRLWTVLVFLIAVLYPFFGKILNIALNVLSVMSIPISIAGFWVSIRRMGARGAFSIFYVLGAVIVFWLVYNSNYYIGYAVEQSSGYFSKINYLFQSLSGFNVVLDSFSRSVLHVIHQIIDLFLISFTIIGFSALFVSGFYFSFGFLKGRDFDDSVHFLFSKSIVSVVSYALLCNVPLAMLNGNFDYAKSVFISLFSLS